LEQGFIENFLTDFSPIQKVCALLINFFSFVAQKVEDVLDNFWEEENSSLG
jgi:hypothetical protein